VVIGLLAWGLARPEQVETEPSAPTNGPPIPSESASILRSEDVIYDFENAFFLAGCGPTEPIAATPGAIDLTPLGLEIGPIAADVEALRDLDFERLPRLELLSEDELIAKTTELYEKEESPEELADSEAMLKLLRLIDQDVDLSSIVKEAVTTQIEAFYMPKNETIFAPAKARDDLTPLEEVVLAHELEHALADQTLKLPIQEKLDPATSDQELAARALVEGDATLLMQQYAIAALDPDERNSFLEEAAGLQTETGDLPYILQRSIAFPYHEGLLFVCNLYKSGGWEAIDAAYRNPPRSTAEILFPERYGDDKKVVNPPDPPTLRGWEHRSTPSFGAADLLLMLEAPNGEPTGRPFDTVFDVARWGGGELHIYKRSDDYAIRISLIDDASRAIAPFQDTLCEPLRDWVTYAFEPLLGLSTTNDRLMVWKHRGLFILLWCGQVEPRRPVNLVIAPDVASGKALIGSASRYLPRPLSSPSG